MKGGEPAMVGVDWGSSRLRAYLLNGEGGVLDEIEDGEGVFAGRTDFERIFGQVCGGWLSRTPGIPVLMAGMVGSRQGWVETEYVPCPVSLPSLGRRIARMPTADGDSLYIVPGVSNVGPSGLPDVIRGEETQLFGSVGEQESDDLIACFPGTHCKWTQVERGHIVRFSTFMTGELFSALSECTSLAPFLNANEDSLDEAAFLEGVALSRRGGGLSHQAFSIRSRPLVERRPCVAGSSRLSGLLIGAELEAGLKLYPGIQKIVIVGAEELGARYRLAFAEQGVDAQLITGQQAFVSGAWRLATVSGILASNSPFRATRP